MSLFWGKHPMSPPHRISDCRMPEQVLCSDQPSESKQHRASFSYLFFFLCCVIVEDSPIVPCDDWIEDLSNLSESSQRLDSTRVQRGRCTKSARSSLLLCHPLDLSHTTYEIAHFIAIEFRHGGDPVDVANQVGFGTQECLEAGVTINSCQ